MIIFKTTKEKVRQLRAFVKKERPYETPEIIEVEVARVTRTIFPGLSNLLLLK